MKNILLVEDDYITKPFKLNELISRIRALLRRSNVFEKEETELKSNGITIEFLNNHVFKNGEILELTAAEYKLLTNKDIRRLFCGILAILTLALLSSLIFSQVVVYNFKSEMLAHDYEVAGYLLEHGTRPSDVSAAFAAIKTEKEFSSGENLLQTLGYKKDMNNRLLPDANMLLSRYRFIFMLSTVIFGTSIITVFFLYFKHQQNTIEKANTAINTFMSGDATARIDSDEEGSLYKLFVIVNSITTSLNAHVETEKHTKEFLKNTIADISHQLKTPLAALKMYNEIMQEESDNEETIKKFTAKMESSLERIEILIKNLLKITKLDAEAIVLDKKEENIRAIVQDSISSLETRAVQEQKSITLNGSDDAVLYCDEDWIVEAHNGTITVDSTLGKGSSFTLDFLKLTNM